MLHLYVRPGHAQCEATKRRLEDAGIVFRLINLDERGTVVRHLVDADLLALPVCDGGEARFTWCGFQPRMIDAWIAHDVSTQIAQEGE